MVEVLFVFFMPPNFVGNTYFLLFPIPSALQLPHSSGFKMAHFEAYLHVMTVGTSNKCAVNMNIMTRTLQTEANGKFGKEKVKKTAFFLDKTFFLGNFLYF